MLFIDYVRSVKHTKYCATSKLILFLKLNSIIFSNNGKILFSTKSHLTKDMQMGSVERVKRRSAQMEMADWGLEKRDFEYGIESFHFFSIVNKIDFCFVFLVQFALVCAFVIHTLLLLPPPSSPTRDFLLIL